MKVTFIAPFDLRTPAGHTTHVLATVREFTRKGHEVTLFARSCSEDLLASTRFRAVPALDRQGLQSVTFGMCAAPMLAIELIRRRCDVVYTRYFRSASLCLLAARLAKVPVIVEVNSDTTNERRANRRGPLLSSVESVEERAIYRLSGAIIAVTEAVALNVKCIEPKAGGKITVVENGVDTTLHQPRDRDRCARKHGLDPARKRIVFTGGFSLWQGILDLVAAMELVVHQRPEADLLLVGDGPLRPAIDRAVAAAQLEGRVSITGYVSEIAASELISASDVCVAPYNTDAVGERERDKYRLGALMRGSPLKIYTYMACARPIVASHFREAGKYLEENGAGVAVPPEDPRALARAILEILAEPERATSMGQRGRWLAEAQHDWSNIVDRYLEVVAAVI